MALSVCGLARRGRAAPTDGWPSASWRDGSWFNYYLADGVKDPRLDTNVCAYVATGLFHHFLVTGDADLLARRWPMVEAAIDFVLRWQRPDGSILWSLDRPVGARPTPS